VPETFLRSKRAVAVAVAATVVGVSAAVLLSGQSTTARAAVAPGATVRASVADGADGAQAPDGGTNQELSADGTAVVFTSQSKLDNLDPAEYPNVYVRDLRRDRTVMISRGQFRRPEPPPSTTPEPPPPPTFDPPHLAGDPLLSLTGAQEEELEFGEFPPNGGSYQPTISADGRFVAFITQADNMVPEDDDGDLDLLVCDRDPDGDGEFDEEQDGRRVYEYFRVNQPTWEEGDGSSYRTDFPSSPRLSDDASRIVWEDEYDPPEGYSIDVVRTAALQPPGGGAVGEPGTVEIVDTTIGKSVPLSQGQPDVSGDGRHIVLVAQYSRPQGEGYIPFLAVIRKDTVTGAVLRVDWDVNTTPEHITYLAADESTDLLSPSISGNGGEIAFEAEEFHDTCSDGCWNSVADQPMVFVVRIGPDGQPVDSIIASRDNDNEMINGFSPALSGDGRFLAFGTDNLNAHDGTDGEAGNSSCVNYNPDTLRGEPMVNLSGLPPTSEDRNQRTVCQVVVRDLVVDRQRHVNEEPRLPGTLASAAGDTEAGNGNSPPYYRNTPSLSHNGSTIAFDSDASNLVPGDDNQRTDVFVRTFRPGLEADPTPLDFGAVELGDAFDKVVRFDHVGTGPLVVTEIAVDGSDEFAVGAQTCRGEAIVLQQTGNCEVSLTFAPTTEGDRTATLRLTLRDGREFTVPLRGKGSVEEVPADGPRFAAGPDPLNFGDRLLLSPNDPTQVVTVTNLGDSPLTITGVEVVPTPEPADFTIVANTCAVVPANGTCQVTVGFSPKTSGDRTAVLRFTDNAPGGAAHLIGITGKGSTPNIEVSPGVTPPARVVMVTGTGFAPNQLVTITLTGGVEKETVQANGTGAFTKSLLVLPKSSVGSRPVVATINGTTISAARPLLVVTPSVSPAEFVGRG
jgi:hypothetical protein